MFEGIVSLILLSILVFQNRGKLHDIYFALIYKSSWLLTRSNIQDTFQILIIKTYSSFSRQISIFRLIKTIHFTSHHGTELRNLYD